MTRQEFEARTNVSLTQELFWEVNEEYNQSEKNVDAFCKWWIKNRQHDYTKRITSDICNLTEKVNMLEMRIKEYQIKMADLRDERNSARSERNRVQAQYNELSCMLAQIKEIINA